MSLNRSWRSFRLPVSLCLFVLALGGAWAASVAGGIVPRRLLAQQTDTPTRAAADSLAQPAPPAPVVAQPQAPAATPVSVATRLSGVLGILLILGIAIAMSRNRRAIRWKTVAWGLGLQLAFAIFVLRVPFGQTIFRNLGAFVTRILSYA